MPFNPQASYRGDAWTMQGMGSIANSIGKMGDELKKQKEELKKREQEDKELSQKIKVFGGKDSTIDLTQYNVDQKRGIYAGLLDKENSQVNQANIRQSDMRTKQMEATLNQLKQENEGLKKFRTSVLDNPDIDLTPYQRERFKSNVPLTAGEQTRIGEEQGALTHEERIGQAHALVAGAREDRQSRPDEAKVEALGDGALLLIIDKNGPRVVANPSYQKNIPTTDMKNASHLEKLIAEQRWDEAARFLNGTQPRKPDLTGESKPWTPEELMGGNRETIRGDLDNPILTQVSGTEYSIVQD